MKKLNAFIILGICLFSQFAFAQTDPTNSPTNSSKIITPVQLSGPRVGVTHVFPGKTANDLKSEFGMTPTFTQFGWQFEHQYFSLENGVAGLVEFVGLIGGLEQGKFLPSASLLIGIRGAQGAEFAFGPNLSLAGAGFVFAAGHTYKSGNLNLPVNFAVVPSTNGVRLSLLVGFNAQTR